jgi:hypothetical protein
MRGRSNAAPVGAPRDRRRTEEESCSATNVGPHGRRSLAGSRVGLVSRGRLAVPAASSASRPKKNAAWAPTREFSGVSVDRALRLSSFVPPARPSVARLLPRIERATPMRRWSDRRSGGEPRGRLAPSDVGLTELTSRATAFRVRRREALPGTQRGEALVAGGVFLHPDRRPTAHRPHLAEARVKLHAARSTASVAMHAGDHPITDLCQVF